MEPKEDKVRVLRVLEYVGPRSWAEKMIAERTVKGMRIIRPTRDPEDGCFIREAIIGEYPEILHDIQIYAEPDLTPEEAALIDPD